MRGDLNVSHDKPIMLPNICTKHQSLLIHQAKYKETDAWQALLICANLVLFQAVTCDARTHEQTGGDIHRISEFGCLACRKPDSFGAIVEVAKSHDLGKIKSLGEQWIAKNEAKK
jgi:hypothetical protein